MDVHVGGVVRGFVLAGQARRHEQRGPKQPLRVKRGQARVSRRKVHRHGSRNRRPALGLLVSE